MKLIILFILLFAGVPTAYSHSGGTDAQGGHTNKQTGEYHFHNRQVSKTSPLQNSTIVEVISVVDGDTLKISYKGQEDSIRLIGIDTPESRVNKKAKRDAKRSGQDIETIIAMGKRATKYVKSLVKQGDLITIEFDVQARDRYGRILGYVYLPNGKLLNEEIVKAGYASVMTIPPNIKYKDIFLNAFKAANENRRGLWKK